MTRVLTNRFFASEAIERSQQILVALRAGGCVACRITHLPPALAIRVARCKYPTAGELHLRRLDECTKQQQKEALQRPIYGQREAAQLIESGRLPVPPKDPLATVAEALQRRFAKVRAMSAGGGL